MLMFTENFTYWSKSLFQYSIRDASHVFVRDPSPQYEICHFQYSIRDAVYSSTPSLSGKTETSFQYSIRDAYRVVINYFDRYFLGFFQYSIRDATALRKGDYLSLALKLSILY